MYMDAMMDTGDMIDVHELSLKRDETVIDLVDRIQETCPQWITDVLWEYGA